MVIMLRMVLYLKCYRGWYEFELSQCLEWLEFSKLDICNGWFELGAIRIVKILNILNVAMVG